MPNTTAIDTSQQRRVDVKSLLNRKESNMPKGIKIIKKGSTGLDKNSFLKILLKQLQYQDPLKPQQDKDFIAQMAQFSALEQMKNVATEVKSLKKFQANFLVGKVITGRDFVTGQAVAGLVKSIIYDSAGQVFLRVNGRSVKMDAITSVQNASPKTKKSVPQKQYRPIAQQRNTTRPQIKQIVSRETIVTEQGSKFAMSKMAQQAYTKTMTKKDSMGQAAVDYNQQKSSSQPVSSKRNAFSFLQKPQGALQNIGSQVEIKTTSNKKEKGN